MSEHESASTSAPNPFLLDLTPTEIAIGLGLAFLAGLFCALDARRHGRSPLIWFAIAFLFPLPGLLAWLLVRRFAKPGARAGGAVGRSGDRCAQCGNAQPATYGFCPGCGADRPAPAPEEETAPTGREP